MVAFSINNFLNDTGTTNYRCVFDSYLRYREKGIKIFELTKDYKVGGVQLNKSSKVILPKDKFIVVSCTKDQQIGNDIIIPSKSYLLFYEGRLISAMISEPVADKKIIFQERSFIFFNKDNGISSGGLRDNTEIQGIILQAKSVVSFHSNGSLESGKLAQSKSINGSVFIENTLVGYREDGSLEYVELAADTQIGDYLFRKGAHVSFHKSGQVNVGMIAREETVEGTAFPELCELTFDEKGKCIEAEVDEFVFKHEGKEYPLFLKDVELNGVKIQLMKLYNNKRYTIIKPFSYKGVTYPTGSVLEFDKNNHATSIQVEAVNPGSYSKVYLFREDGSRYLSK